MKTFLRIYFTICFLFFSLFSLKSQISGVVNQYTSVTAIDYTNTIIEVSDPSSFALNDRVLLIQMQGAIISEGNNSTFGTITSGANLNSAGLYEMGTVCNVFGDSIFLEYNLQNTYDVGDGLQLVKVYTGINETVNGTVSASPWNGTTGGVIAIELSGTLTLNADIDASEQGFRGGAQFQSSYTGCNFIVNHSNYFYPFNGGNALGATKGEGIAEYIANKEYGKGKQANGGGGGNDHNTGGGGGSNYNAGGNGGNFITSTFGCTGSNPGIGGLALNIYGYSGGNNRVFLGGGGGSGQDDNNNGKDGGNGGGIILIIADQIEGNGFTIASNGGTPNSSSGDGGAGGGAGGTILFSTNGFGTTALTVEANGGNGGNVTTTACAGPGGGGSGGVIWTATALSGMVSPLVNGGASGLAVDCSFSPQSATGGSSGVQQTGFSVPEDVINISACVLQSPVELFVASDESGKIGLSWSKINQELNNIWVEKLHNDQFTEIDQVSMNQDQWFDSNPENGINTYRLALQWKNGNLNHSNTVEVFWENSKPFSIDIFPNPVQKNQDLKISFELAEAGKVKIEAINVVGQSVVSEEWDGIQGGNLFDFPLSTVKAGSYFLKLTYKGETEIRRFMKMN